MLKNLLDFFVGISKTRAKGTGIFSLAISTAMTAVVYAITTIVTASINKDGSSITMFGIDTWGVAAIVCIYVFLFVGIWTVTYILEQSDAEDLYTWVRKLMLGTWTARYPLKSGQGNDDLLDHDPRAECHIYINELNKKLEMRFAIDRDRVWADKSQIIDLIGLKNVVQNDYVLIYYFKGLRTLTERAASHIVPEHAGQSPNQVEVEILGHIEFTARRGTQVKNMKGKWFDLNGNINRVHLLMQKVDDSEMPHEYRSKLLEVNIPQENAFAPGGEIFFSRVIVPKNSSNILVDQSHN